MFLHAYNVSVKKKFQETVNMSQNIFVIMRYFYVIRLLPPRTYCSKKNIAEVVQKTNINDADNIC